MKKLALLVGSLLAVSAVASAKEVVPAPAAAPEVKVVEKIVQVPVERIVEKIVEKEVIKEVEKKGAKGSFSVSYEVPLYSDKDIFGEGHKWASFWAPNRMGDLSVSTKVQITPKHKVYASAKMGLELVPSYEEKLSKDAKAFKIREKLLAEAKEELETLPEGEKEDHKKYIEELKEAVADSFDKVEAEVKKTGEKSNWVRKAQSNKLKSFKVGYEYKYNDKASLDLSLAHPGSFKLLEKDYYKDYTKAKAAVKFDAAEYFFSTDNFKTTELSITPSYAYSWSELYKKDGFGWHEVAVDLAAKFEVPYGIELGVEATPVKYVVSGAKDSKGLLFGKAKVTASKTFKLLEKGSHTVDFSNDLSYGVASFYSENLRKDNNDSFLGARTFTYEPALKYTYKINDYTSVFANLGGELEMEASKVKKGEEVKTHREWNVSSKVKTGLNVKF